ncbi:MAG: hypothetical protein RL131_921 [Bacteroidota bacterium]
MNYESNEFESLLKERSDQYLLYPSERVWKNIHKELHPNRSWMYFSLFLLLFLGSATAVVVKKQKASGYQGPAGIYAQQWLEKNQFPATENSSAFSQNSSGPRSLINQEIESSKSGWALEDTKSMQEKTVDKSITVPETLQPLVLSELPAQPGMDASTSNKKTIKSKNLEAALENALENVIDVAKQISKKATWQVYGGPTLSYRKLTGEASRSNFQYASFPFSTNSLFATNVKDAVYHRPGMGFELGAAMYYPITSKLSLKTGLQLNYNHYQIDAYKGAPEIANYGMNNFGFGSSPISAVSVYRSSGGYMPVTLRNEHYMISIPLGVDYVVAGNKKLNFSIGSTIQPTYVFANYSYLISTNLKNYAKEPSLNRRWNLNSAFEANINFKSGGFKWSVGPQFRYQLISSFKEKYPIRENLMDMGIKLGIIKTIN